MWNRAEVKAEAKKNFKKNYAACVIVALIFVVINFLIFGGSSVSFSSSEDGVSLSDAQAKEIANQIIDYLKAHPIIIAGIVGGSVVGFIISLLIKLFIAYQIEVGVKGFFSKNTYSQPTVGDIFETYRNGSLGNVAKTIFCRDIFITLWFCLLIIPGIIKSYEYEMIPYLLADNPDMSRKEAFARSKQMTNGHKMALFVMDLSFIGWYLLSACTCGILAILYVNPYREQAFAQVYEKLK